MLQSAAEPSSPVCVATVNHHGQQPPTCWDFAHKSHVILTTSTSSISLYLTRTGRTTAYLSNHVQLNKINNRAHQSYTAGLAATVQLSVCLTTGVIRTSLHYQSITLKQPCTSLCCPARPACCHSPPRRGGGGGWSSPMLSLLPLDTHQSLVFCRLGLGVEFNQTCIFLMNLSRSCL